jgi:hypothetical protein
VPVFFFFYFRDHLVEILQTGVDIGEFIRRFIGVRTRFVYRFRFFAYQPEAEKLVISKSYTS